MKNQYLISTLSELLLVTAESETGCAICARHARAEALRGMFAARASRCAAAAFELRTLIVQLGGDPATRIRLIGASQRGWVHLREALAQDDDGALVEECEHGEDHALEIYRNALDDSLPEGVRGLVLRQFEDMMGDHDRIRLLRSEPIVDAADFASRVAVRQ